MCTRYISPEDREIEAAWQIGARNADRWMRSMRPLYKGPIMRRARDVTEYERELVIGQWGMIPPWCASNIPTSKPRKGETKGKRLATVNARTERMAKSPTYRNAWLRGQRCIIPARSFDEPCWETGKNEWWRFHRADGAPWGIAGLWDVWRDPATGEEWDSYTMLTLNANLHPIMARMHKPEIDRVTKKPLEVQDKRSLVAIEAHDFDRWLTCTVEEAREMLQLIPVHLIDAAPAPLEKVEPAAEGDAEMAEES